MSLANPPAPHLTGAGSPEFLSQGPRCFVGCGVGSLLLKSTAGGQAATVPLWPGRSPEFTPQVAARSGCACICWPQRPGIHLNDANAWSGIHLHIYTSTLFPLNYICESKLHKSLLYMNLYIYIGKLDKTFTDCIFMQLLWKSIELIKFNAIL